MLDRAPGGGWVPGGPSLYTARQVAALGAKVSLVTRLAPDYPRRVLRGIDLIAAPAEHTPRYANSYDASGARTQLLLDVGESLEIPPNTLPLSDLQILAPAFRELPAAVLEHPGTLTSVNLQGLLRQRDAAGRISPVRPAWPAVRPFTRPGAWYFLSEEDCPDSAALGTTIATAGGNAVVTAGERGATLFTSERQERIRAIPALLAEPTGAGDCFAATFMVALAEGKSVEEASQMASAAGALAVEGSGLAAVPTRAQVLARLERVAA